MRKICKYMATALATSMLFMCLNCGEVYAGHSRVSVDSSSFAEDIHTAVWKNPEGDVATKDGAIHFTKASTKYTRLITKSMVKKEETSEEFTTASLKLQLKSMPENGEFILGFGLASVESFSKDAGQIEIAFINKQGLKLDVRSYDKEAKESIIVQGKGANFSLGSKANIDVSIKCCDGSYDYFNVKT